MLEDSHFAILSDYLTISEFEQDQEIYQMNDERKNFYILIRGKVKLTKKSDEGTTNWQWALDAYQSLIKWKEQEFDRKVDEAMQGQLTKVKLSESTVQHHLQTTDQPERPLTSSNITNDN